MDNDEGMNSIKQTAVIARDKLIKSSQRTAKIIGVFYILAAVTSIIALYIYYQPILGPDYLVKGAANANSVIMGAIIELILVVSLIGTAVGLFPFLRKYNEHIALGYFSFRFLEAVLVTVGIVAILALLNLSQSFVAAAVPNISSYQAVGTVLISIHNWTFLLGPNLMLGINTVLYSYLLYISRLVPRPIATLGLIGATLILLAAFLEISGVILQVSFWGGILALPVAAFEMALAVWLIIKGFNPSAIK